MSEDHSNQTPLTINPATLKYAVAWVPQISIAAIFLTAVFNVGYFSEIGLHFIGMADFTNFVYSFALVFGFIVGSLQFVFLLIRDFLQFGARPAETWLRWRKWYFILAGLIVLISVVGMIVPRRFVPDLFYIANPWGQVAIFTTLAIAQLFSSYLWARLSILSFEDAGYVLVLVCLAVFWWGKAIAYNQIFGSQRYTITTRDGVLEEAALVRASAAGFVIAIDGRISFLPTQEVQRIDAEKTIQSAE